MKSPRVTATACVLSAARCLILGAHCGLLLGDPGLYNFGVVGAKVVIIDAGGREVRSEPMAKGEANQKVRSFSNVRSGP